ncbi:MAG: O-antigen ligase family protein [Pirellulales bacterium]
MMWWIVVVSLVALFLAVSLKKGPQMGMATVVPIAWLFPAWLMIYLVQHQASIVGKGIDVKVAVGTTCLILYCFLPGRTFPVRLVASDFAMLGLFFTHILSDISHDGFNWEILGRAYVEWYLPYVAGRVAFQSQDALKKSWRVIAFVGLALAIISIIEAATEVNLLETAFDVRPEEGLARDKTRWGFHRAYGPTLNPIYFGVVQVLLLGWTLHGAVRAVHRRASSAWIIALIISIIGVIGTGSRGPLVGVVATVYFGAFYFLPKSRAWLIGLAAICLVVGVVFKEPIISTLERRSGEDRRQKEFTVDGETRKHSSIRARFALFEVNKFALKHSGLLGFGTTAVSGFPVNVPVGQVDAEALKRVWTIENTYALVTLRFGYLGVSFLIIAGALVLWQFFKVSEDHFGSSTQWICGSLGATTAAVLLIQNTVWMPHEIGFPLLWTFGLSAGLSYANRKGDL